MAFPQTIDEMTKQGYRFESGSTCRGCGADIEWWVTPRGKKMPCNYGTATPHWSTCPNANDFRKEK